MMQRKTQAEKEGLGASSRGRVLIKRKSIYGAIKRAVKYIAYGVMGYLLSSLTLPFNTRPLGVAVIASSTEAVPFVLLGAFFGAIRAEGSPLIYLCTYGALVLMRLFLSVMSDDGGLSQGRQRGHFEDGFFSRLISVLVVSFVIGIYKLIAGGFRYYDLAGAFFCVAVALASTFFLSVCLDKGFAKRLCEGKKRASALLPVLEGASRLALAFLLIYAARPIRSHFISLSAVGACFITLLASRERGALRSGAVGLVLGAASSLATAPLFMMAGCVSSLLFKISPLSALITACLCAGVWGGYVGGAVTVAALMPSMVVACGLVYLWDRLLKGEGGKLLCDPDGDGARRKDAEKSLRASETRASLRLSDRDEQLKAISGAFSSLSEMFFNLSDRLRRPGVLDLRRMCDGAFDIYCPGCPDRELCWGLEYASTLEVLRGLSEHLHTHGRVDLDCLPVKMKERCSNTENIISEINRNCAKMTEEALKSEKTEVYALDYEGMARILCDTLSTDDEEYSNNVSLAESVAKYLSDCGFGETSVVCFGGRRKQIVARGLGPFRAAIYSDHLREDIEELSGYQLVGPIFEHGDGYAPPSMVFTARPMIRAECVCKTVAAEEERSRLHDFTDKLGIYGAVERWQGGEGRSADGEGEDGIFALFKRSELSDARKDKEERIDSGAADTRCGDTVNLFVGRKDYMYALISDGMGTGADAAFTSELCSVFLEKMLSAGNSVETTLRMLNGLVRSKGAAGYGSECSATVDLLELDLLSGEASFVKSGAAQSYVIRDGGIYRLMSKTLPIGILRTLDAERMKIELQCGDIIVMVSDGITQGSESCNWLCDLLVEECRGKAVALDGLADKIIARARKASRLMGFERCDDASVVIIRLLEFGEGAAS